MCPLCRRNRAAAHHTRQINTHCRCVPEEAFFPAGTSNNDWTPVVQTFDGVEMVRVPAGCFMMGSEVTGIGEGPAHRVCLSAFWIGQTEVTNAQYKQCVEAGACTPPSDRSYYDSPGYADHPVVSVNWEQASAFAVWIGGSLPTEAQWEYAARGPEGWNYPWGNAFDGTRLNSCDNNCELEWQDTRVDDGYAQTAPVGMYQNGASWVGALDLLGNVWEWAADWYDPDYYDGLADGVLDPTGPTSGTDHVLRGAAWYGYYNMMYSTFRNRYDPIFDRGYYGFRVAVTSPAGAVSAEPTPVAVAPEGVFFPAGSSNNDWTPVVQTFDGVEMVRVPAGCFMMGSEDGANSERPMHRVCFEAPFWIDRTEVTNGQFEALNGQAANSSSFSGDNRPREQITWPEAEAFCASRGERLPTEAEWEYAARGPESWMYPWGNEFVVDNSVWTQTTGITSLNVGSKPAGASWVGALDMSGNVKEWVADWYDENYYASLGDGVINPTGPASGEVRVLRGGSWGDTSSSQLRAARRDFWYVFGVAGSVGFRCARSAE